MQCAIFDKKMQHKGRKMKSNRKRDEMIICRCEEISAGEIETAVTAGAADVDAVKRMTTAGMGLCQGRTCSRLVTALIAEKLNADTGDIRQCRQRNPVRPVSARVAAGS
jgi:NAD(P)H-nitrite reductase large subunit